MQALRNIVEDLAFQFRLKGSLFSRLSCVSLYYALYVAARAWGATQAVSRLRALGILGRLGFSRRPAVVRTADGLIFELDIYAACCLGVVNK